MNPNTKMAEKCVHSQMVHCSHCHARPFPEIIMSGYLVKSPPLNKSILVKRWKKRYFILRANARLEYYQEHKSPDPLTVIDLAQTLRIEAGLETRKYANIFDLILPGRTYFFSAGHIELMFEWVRQIKRLLDIQDEVVYPQKSASKPLTPGDPLLQCYINQARGKMERPLDRSVEVLGGKVGARNSSGSEEDRPANREEANWLKREETEFRASLIRSNHYTVVSREKLPSDDSAFLDPGPQWSERNDSFNRIKEFIRSTGSVVAIKKQVSETKFYSPAYNDGSKSLPDYAQVRRPYYDTEQVAFTRLKSVEDSYELAPPPIPPKIRPKSPLPKLEPDLESIPEPTGLQRRLPSLSRMGKIKVGCPAKEGVGQFAGLAPESQSNDDVVCFGTIVKKVFGAQGGRISFRDSDTQVEVPSGAIPAGQIHGFYFKVSPDSGFVEEGASESATIHVCSPLIQFGPVGAKFNEPIKIQMSHCLNTEAKDYQVQLILAYGDVFSPNGMNYLRIDASREDFELEMFSFNTILGPVVFNLQPRHVTLEISHFLFQWVQLVAISRAPKLGRDFLQVSKRVRLCCFLSDTSPTSGRLAVYLHNDCSHLLSKLRDEQAGKGGQFLGNSDTFLVSVSHSPPKAQISLDDLEFGFKINGRAKQVVLAPAKDSASVKCEFELEKLFDNAKPFSGEIQLRINGQLVTSLDLESAPDQKSQIKSAPNAPTRAQLLADALGVSGAPNPDTPPLTLLAEAGRKLGCEVSLVSDALKQLDAAELIGSPKH